MELLRRRFNGIMHEALRLVPQVLSQVMWIVIPGPTPSTVLQDTGPWKGVETSPRSTDKRAAAFLSPARPSRAQLLLSRDPQTCCCPTCPPARTGAGISGRVPSIQQQTPRRPTTFLSSLLGFSNSKSAQNPAPARAPPWRQNPAHLGRPW